MGKPNVLKLEEVQRELGISRWTLYNWLKSGKLQGFKLPCGHYRVPAEELTRFRSQEVQGEQAKDTVTQS